MSWPPRARPSNCAPPQPSTPRPSCRPPPCRPPWWWRAAKPLPPTGAWLRSGPDRIYGTSRIDFSDLDGAEEQMAATNAFEVAEDGVRLLMPSTLLFEPAQEIDLGLSDAPEP